jgi:apolipoprotein N-acyltransferase
MGFVHKHSAFFAILAVLASAGLFRLGNGINPSWPLMWIAPIPVLLLAAFTPSGRVAGAGAAFSMLLGSLEMLYYLHSALRLPIAAWFIPYAIISLLFSAGVLMFRALLHRGAALSAVIVLPAFWTVCEFIASFVPANGTAGSLAYTQERFLPMLQVASLTGPWGISFLLLLFPAAVAAGSYLRRRSPRSALLVVAVATGATTAAIVFGALRLMAPTSRETIKVGLLDTDTVEFAGDAAKMRQLIQSYATEAETLARQGAKIVLMPEKTGLLLGAETPTADTILQSVADRSGATLIIGVQHVVAPQSFNQARIYTPNQPVATYNKQHMLPPFESSLTPGASLTMLPKSNGSIGVAICKDMDFIHPALDYGRAGIALLLDPAWDFNIDRAWHGHIAIMRGVEGGYAIAHAAKDGFLTVTDNRGRILGEARTGGERFTSLLVDVPLRHDQTVFNRYGGWFPWMAGLLVLAAAARGFAGSRVALGGHSRDTGPKDQTEAYR